MAIHCKHWLWRSLLGLLLALSLVGCAKQELYTGLTEHQANEMVALLQNAGIASTKEVREPSVYAITTAQDNFSRAIELLHANGLPRGSFETVGQVFKKEGFVSSPVEERARLTYALSQELSNTLQNIDGVVVARVHLAVPDKDPLSDKPKPASASVFIKHRPGRDLSSQVAAMKALVVNGVEGLPYDNVTVALFPADALPASNLAATKSSSPVVAAASLGLPLTIAAGIGAAVSIFGALLWWLRRRSAATGGMMVVPGHDKF
jgi:type III secretion protein J